MAMPSASLTTSNMTAGMRRLDVPALSSQTRLKVLVLQASWSLKCTQERRQVHGQLPPIAHRCAGTHVMPICVHMTEAWLPSRVSPKPIARQPALPWLRAGGPPPGLQLKLLFVKSTFLFLSWDLNTGPLSLWKAMRGLLSLLLSPATLLPGPASN